MLASDLGLGNDQLQGIATVGLVNRVLQDTDRLQQVSRNPDLPGEVGGIGNDLLGLGLELHLGRLVITVPHSGLDARDLAVIVEHLVDVGVQHVGTTVDSRQTSEALGKLTQAIQGVDVRRLSVTGHGVDVEADAVDSLGGGARLVNVLVRWEQCHGVTDEVTGVLLEAELVVNILHGARTDVQSYVKLDFRGA